MSKDEGQGRFGYMTLRGDTTIVNLISMELHLNRTGSHFCIESSTRREQLAD